MGEIFFIEEYNGLIIGIIYIIALKKIKKMEDLKVARSNRQLYV